MDKRIRVLGICPYEGMKTVMNSVAEEFPELDLTICVGNLEQGVTVAQNNFHGDYDAIISRGGTAHLLQRSVNLPVIEIEISVYDILCALKIAGSPRQDVAIVTFGKCNANIQSLGNLLDCHLDMYTPTDLPSLEEALRQIRQKGYCATLCDMIANTTAQRMGIRAYLITSGTDSVRSAFINAMLLCRSIEQVKAENLFLRDLLNGQIGDTVVFRQNGDVYLSTVADRVPELMDILKKELPETEAEPDRRILRMVNGTSYTIRARRFSMDGEIFSTFFVVARRSPLPSNQSGLRMLTRAEAEEELYSSFFSFTGLIADYTPQIHALNKSAGPVLICGENGAGKGSVAQALYLDSPWSKNAFIHIRCDLADERSWSYLTESSDSPLFEEHVTLYFANVDALSSDQLRRLIYVLRDAGVCRRDRVLFSSVLHAGGLSDAGTLIMDNLSCLTLSITPLRKLSARIPTLINLICNHINVDLANPILGLEANAVSQLQAFSWPHNYTQFQRVMNELATTSNSSIISARHVSQLLQKERHLAAVSAKAENGAIPLDLSRTLEQIDRDVALRVVEDCGGNQTAAAKRMGISRTTLWRILK